MAPYSRTSASQRSQVMDSGGTFSDASACSSMRSPSIADSRCCSDFRKWRMRERALPVATKFSHDALGRAVGVVTISTWSPFLSSVRSGMSS